MFASYLLTTLMRMRGSRNFCQRGSNFDNVLLIFLYVFVLIDQGIQIPLQIGHHRSASKTPFKWRFAGVPMMVNIECWLGRFVIFQGFWTGIAKKSYIFVIFQEGVPIPFGSSHGASSMSTFLFCRSGVLSHFLYSLFECHVGSKSAAESAHLHSLSQRNRT